MSLLDGGKSRSRGASRKSKSRKAGRSVSKRSGSRKANPWITFTKKNRASVIAKLKKKRNYPEGQKGQMKLQQDAMKEMSVMWHSRKGGCGDETC